MKYVYGNVEKNEIIKNYKIVDNKIIVTYLDGSNLEFDLSRENELLDIMMRQAIERNNCAKEILNDANIEKIIYAIAGGIGISYVTPVLIQVANIYKKPIALSIPIMLSIVVLSLLYKEFEDDSINELKKYNIYLSMYEKLEKMEKAELFKGIKTNENILNINTLDNYSLKDIKTIKNNLEKYETNGKVLTKKLC